MAHILDFEREIYEIENQIDELTSLSIKIDSVGDITHDVAKLKKKLRHLKKDVFAGLNGWQKTQVARHPDRPYTLDYINYMLTDFIELHGDRRGGHGPSIVSGLAKFDGQSVMVIGHQKGRDTEEKIRRNFGMSQPGGYRKALRVMLLAEKFNIPIITLIDTPGAYPGVEAEEFGQSEAIARNMFEMSRLKVPIISTVIGEVRCQRTTVSGCRADSNLRQPSTYCEKSIQNSLSATEARGRFTDCQSMTTCCLSARFSRTN